MSRIKSYTIHMEPFCVGGDQMVEVSCVVDGEVASIRTVLANSAPYEAEAMMLHRMGMQMIEGLRRKERHEDCCCHKKCCCCK